MLLSEESLSLAFAKAEYLHRTVRDFVESDDIWAQIKAAASLDFNPYVSLCQPFLLQLKCLPSTFKSKDDFRKELWHLATWCVQNGGEAERTTQQPQTRILDELDRV